jgi:hypothetical protein
VAGLNLVDLERRSYRRGGRRQPISPEVLGRIIACAWRAQNDIDASSYLTSDALSKIILDHAADMPSELQSVLHVERRIDGDQVEETTDLLVGAQRVGVIGRLNPSNVQAVLKADRLQAYALLDDFRSTYPEIVAWAEKLADGHP